MKKCLITSAIAVLLIMVLITCKKAPEIEYTTNKKTLPIVETLDVVNITISTAGCGGDVTDIGNSLVTEKGVCWDINYNPTIAHKKTTDGGGSGEFESLITELEDGITYYVRAYATNENGTSYGEQKSFSDISYSSPNCYNNCSNKYYLQ